MEETQFEALHVHINAPVANSDEHSHHGDVVSTSLTSQAEESCFYAFGLHDILLQLALGHSLSASQSAFASLPREVMYLDIARHVRALYMQDLSDRGFLTPVQMTMDYAGQTCPGAPRKVTTQSTNSSTVSLDQPLVYYSFRERAAHSQSLTNVLQCLQHAGSTAEHSQLGALPARGRGREESEGEREMDRGRGDGGSDASERGGGLQEGREEERESQGVAVSPKKVVFWWSPWTT